MSHQCHHPTCALEVPPKLLACKAHWYQLPKELRDRIWATYRSGQERTKDPSAEYLEAFGACQKWWTEHSTPRAKS